MERDIKNQTGRFFAYVMNSDGEEADTFSLQTWEVYTSPDSCYTGSLEMISQLFKSALRWEKPPNGMRGKSSQRSDLAMQTKPACAG